MLFHTLGLYSFDIVGFE